MKIKLTEIAKYRSEMGIFHSRSGLSRSRNSVFGLRYISKDEPSSLAASPREAAMALEGNRKG